MFSNKDLERYSRQIILKKVGVLGQKKIQNAKVIDLYAGTGILGIEALSLGCANADFVEIKKPITVPVIEKSVFCNTGLCKDETKPLLIDKTVRPKRNIDYGFTCQTKKVKVGVSNKSVPYFWIFVAILIIALVLLFLRR